MDLKQVEYIVEIVKQSNITRAADKLFITQSALNQQLLKLEKELGTPLFYRSRSDCRLTEAGEVYIKNAYELLRIKKETYNTISDIGQMRKGNISVGFTPGRGITMFMNVYPLFHKEYPDVIIEPVELSVRKQQDLISQGQLDIGFLTVCDKCKATLRYINICKENIILAIPKTHALASYATNPFSVINLEKFALDPFVLMYKESSLRPLIDDLFETAGFQPKVLFDTSNNDAIVKMIKSGLCCGIVPYYYIKNALEDIACFYLTGFPTWDMVACYRNGSYLSHASQRFIVLASEYWSKEISS